MKLLRIGVIVATAMALAGHAFAADAKIDPANRAKGMKEAPAVVQTIGLPCTVSDALFLGNSQAKVNGKDVTSSVYEVACKDSLGYFLVSTPGGEDQFYDCLSLRTQADRAAEAAKGGKPPQSQVCTLPGNADPKSALTPLFTQAGTPCSVTAARAIGSSATDKINIYEAHCSNGHGYLLMNPRPGSVKKLAAVDCAASGLFGQKCQLTDEAAITQQIIQTAAAKNPPACQPNGARWVVTSTAGDNYYEISCTDGKSGYIYQQNAQGQVVNVVTCANAQQLAGGCTLTNPDVARTEEAALYTKLAQQSGYPCNVTKYQTLGAVDSVSKREVVELVCSEHPDGVWAFLPTGSPNQKPAFYNCVRSMAFNLNCKLTPMPTVYAALGNQIKAKGKTCDVTNAKPLTGVHAQNGGDFIEVACSGAGGGMVIAYDPTPIETVADVFTCKETAGTTRACTLK